MSSSSALSDRLGRSAPHLLGLVFIVAAAIALGRPTAWIAVFAIAGPPVAAAVGRVAGVDTTGWRSALAFAFVSAAMIAGGWAIMRLPELNQWFIFLFPPALLMFLFGAVNYIALVASRTLRGWRSIPPDYPWIPDVLARMLGTHTEEFADGDR